MNCEGHVVNAMNEVTKGRKDIDIVNSESEWYEA